MQQIAKIIFVVGSHDEIPPLSGQAYIKAGRQNSLFDPNQIAFQVTIAASVWASTAVSD